jgi:hypothetical protein
MHLNALLYEHWLYLPSVGLFLGVTQKIASMLPTARTCAGGAAVALGVALIFGAPT